MRRTCRAVNGIRQVCAPALTIAVAVAMLLTTPGLAGADPGPAVPTDVAALIADVADANQRLQDLGAAVQTRAESVNKAIVDVQTARDTAATAKLDVDASQRAVGDANAAIAAAQKRFDRYAVIAYVNGPSKSFLTASDPDDLIAAASANQTLAMSARQVMTDLQRARTDMVNKASAARAAQLKADQAAADAQRSQDAAVAALTDAQKEFGTQQTELDRVTAQRDAAQARLTAAQATWSTSSGQTAPPPGGSNWDRKPQAAPGAPPFGDASQWDTTLPMVPSAFVSGDPIAIVNAVLQISATSAQVTADLGRNFLLKLGILKPADTGITNGVIPRTHGQRASEYVIAAGHEPARRAVLVGRR